MPPARRAKTNKRNAKKAAPAVNEPSEDPVEETKAIETATKDNSAADEPSQDVTMEEAAPPEEPAPAPEETAPKMTMEERKAKMDELRKKLVPRLERQRKLAETLRTKAEAEERGEDVEREKNWEWTIEDNDNWEKKKARKARRADFEFHDDAHAARRRYKKELDLIKPDLVAYNKQKEIAMGLAPGTLTSFDPKNGSMSTAVVPTTLEQQLAHDNLYRDANTLMYGDSKPSEDAIDRVVSKINKDIDKKSKFSRKRPNEEEGDITYINEANRVFNKKIARYYDKYTSEIRASFERGTAL
ncbi:SYF2 splicing factor-domain-containing protein [Armillaria luteobubalina]|uniref:Pre-mRNA-splicing factor SYF2 n=1 Tax=Armillaria luteobubalina TaxID=153913 RepID=A0AA39TRV5_9AGAR|nr:SYF2 splicing factor-domain-containing protein [Armillaria luteobubalina]